MFREVDIPKALSKWYNVLSQDEKKDAEKFQNVDDCYYVAIIHDYISERKHVYPAIKIRDGEYRFTCDEIVGRHAKLVDGRVPPFIPQDEVYLQYLATLNDLYFEGIEKADFGVSECIRIRKNGGEWQEPIIEEK